MDTDSSKNIGFGSFHPADAEEYAEITITVKDKITEKADYDSNDETVKKCAAAICRLIAGFPAEDILQMNNKAVYYNIDEELPLDRLFCATIAVNAAKKAAMDYMRKNGIEIPSDAVCACLR